MKQSIGFVLGLWNQFRRVPQAETGNMAAVVAVAAVTSVTSVVAAAADFSFTFPIGFGFCYVTRTRAVPDMSSGFIDKIYNDNR